MKHWNKTSSSSQELEQRRMQTEGVKVVGEPTRGLPMRVSFNGEELEVTARLTDKKAVKRLIQVLQANMPLLDDPLAHHHADDLPSNLAEDDDAAS